MMQFTGIQYLQIDVANNMGHDKWTWDKRIAWTVENDHQLEQLLDQADVPALYYASVKALRAAQRGEVSNFPISLDATASGMQILSALTGDLLGAQLCNVVNRVAYMGGTERADGYSIVFDEMKERVGSSAEIKRDMIKKAVMTALYGSKAMPKKVFGEGRLLDIFYETMADLAPAAWELNEHFLQIWNPEALKNSWVLPDNFHVHVKVMSKIEEQVHLFDEPISTFRQVNMPMDEGRSLGANTIHSIDGMIVREVTRMADYNPSQVAKVQQLYGLARLDYDSLKDVVETPNTMLLRVLLDHHCHSGFLSARVIDLIEDTNMALFSMPALDALSELLSQLPIKPFKVIAVHDCFRCLPNYGNDLRRLYTLQLYKVARSNMLSFLLSQIMGHKVEIGKLNPEMVDMILDAEYALS